MRWSLLFAFAFFCTMSASLASVFDSVAYDIYITVGKGQDGQDGPVANADVTIVLPDGSRQSKKSDDEGAVKFSVSDKGRYLITIKASGFDVHEGRVTVDGKEPQVYYLAWLETAKPTQDTVQIRVRVKDGESGIAMEGASVETSSKAQAHTYRMTTDAGGETVVRVPLSQWKRDTEYTVRVSKAGYTQQIQTVRADNRDSRIYPLEFSLTREKGLRLIVVSTREEGTRAPVMSARVVLDGGGDHFQSQETDSAGKAVFQVASNVVYQLKITTTHYETVTDTIDLVQDKSATVSRTYDLEKKPNGKEIRRALIVYVKYKEDGQTKPLKGAVVSGPGLHSQATDESGRFIFLHNVPPGETITVTASHSLFKPGSATALVRDKGVMVDLGQFSRDTTRGGMSDYDAIMKQGVKGFDTCQIVLESAVEKVRRVHGTIESPDETDPGEQATYQIELTYQEGDSDAVTVEEVIVVYGPDGKIFARAGNIRALNMGAPSNKSYSLTPKKGGTYRIKCTVSGPPTADAKKEEVLWTGEKTIRVTENRAKTTLSGAVVPKKGLVKLDETVNVGVNVLYESGPTPDLRVSETVELYDPKGQVVQNNLSHRTLKRTAYSERTFNITCQAPGPYRLKSTIKDESDQVLWTGEGRFTVDKTGKSVMSRGTGYYRLKNKKVGPAPQAGEGPYATFSGSLSESSFSYQYEGKQPWDVHAQFNIQWSVPPTIIKPSETIELTVSGTGRCWGKDAGTLGITAGWNASGSASVVEGRNIFVGKASNGSDHPSGSSKYKIAVGRGGALKIANHQIGAPGLAAETGAPCTYEYEWIEGAAPPSGGGKTTSMKFGGESSKPYNPAAFRSNAVTFGSFGTFSLEISLGRDFHGSGRSRDGKSIITLSGAVDASGRLSGTGTLNRNGTKYKITVDGQRSGSEIVGSMSVRAAKGSIKSRFRLKRG